MSRFGLGFIQQLGSAFGPTDIANGQFWYKTNDLATITEVGGEVSDLADKFNSNDLAQTTASRKPNTGSVNGNAGIYFDEGDFLSASGLTITHTALTMAVVFTPTVAAASDYILAGLAGAGARFDLSLTGADTVQSRVFASSGSFSSPTVNTGALANATRLIIGRHTSSTTGRATDDQANTAEDTAVGTLYASSDVLILGAANTTPSLLFNGFIHEVIGYNAYITDEEVTNLQGYFANEWVFS